MVLSKPNLTTPFTLARETTQERRERVEKLEGLEEKHTPKKSSLQQRLFHLKTIEHFFSNNQHCQFLGYEERGTSIKSEYRKDYTTGLSQIDGFHWKDDNGNRHYYCLGTNIFRFDGAFIAKRVKRPCGPSIPKPRSKEQKTNHYGLTKEISYSSELEFKRHNAPLQHTSQKRSVSKEINSAANLLDALEENAALYENISLNKIENLHFMLELNAGKQYFKIKFKGLHSINPKKRSEAKKNRDFLLAALYSLKQKHPEIDYNHSPRLLKQSRIHLNTSGMVALQKDSRDSSVTYPRPIKQILGRAISNVKLQKVLDNEIPIRKFINSRPQLRIFRSLKYDKGTGTFTYKNIDRPGRYFTHRSEMIRILETDSNLALTIKGKPGLLKKLYWKWGLGIPQLALRSAEFAHDIKDHGLKFDQNSIFVDGADDLDLVLATNKESTQVAEGVSTFMILPMAIDMLNDAIRNESSSLRDSRKQHRLINTLKTFIEISQRGVSPKRRLETIIRCIDTILLEPDLEGLEVERLRHDFKRFKETQSPLLLDHILKSLTQILDEESDNLSGEIKESKLMHRAIFCMAAGLNIHFVVGGIDMATRSFRNLGAITATAANSTAFTDYLNMLANPFAAAGQIMCALASAQKTGSLLSEAKDLKEIQNRVIQAQNIDNTQQSVANLNDCLKDCADFMARERHAIQTGVALNACLVAGQTMMALGTICSSIVTCGTTVPASVLSALETLKTIFSSAGLGATLWGAGGDSIRETIIGKRFSKFFTFEDLKEIYESYNLMMLKNIESHNNTKDNQTLKIRTFVEAKNAYMRKGNFKIYREYIDFQEVSVDLSGKSEANRATRKYINSSKYRELQRHISELNQHKKNIVFSGDKLSYAHSLYELFFDEKMPLENQPQNRKQHLDQWELFIRKILSDQRYRNRFHRSLTHSLLYSTPKNRQWFEAATGQKFTQCKINYFNEYSISKKRLIFGLGIPMLRKRKTLRTIDEDHLFQESIFGILPFCYDAVRKLISDVKKEKKDHLRGVEYGTVQYFLGDEKK
ncbi:MAG: hypothetical protein VYA34_14580 [Myxococcota bacterium]|nr:hypothetical protein [Myxococcota bacterium]